MNYNDALESSISDKMTKAKLVAIANALQDQCLLNELGDEALISYEPSDKPALIPFRSYIKDARARWDIHTIEACAFAKDVYKIGIDTRKAVTTAMDRLWLSPLALRG